LHSIFSDEYFIVERQEIERRKTRINSSLSSSSCPSHAAGGGGNPIDFPSIVVVAPFLPTLASQPPISSSKFSNPINKTWRAIILESVRHWLCIFPSSAFITQMQTGKKFLCTHLFAALSPFALLRFFSFLRAFSQRNRACPPYSISFFILVVPFLSFFSFCRTYRSLTAAKCAQPTASSVGGGGGILLSSIAAAKKFRLEKSSTRFLPFKSILLLLPLLLLFFLFSACISCLEVLYGTATALAP